MRVKLVIPIVVLFLIFAQIRSHDRERRNLVIEWFEFLTHKLASTHKYENVKQPLLQQQQQQQQSLPQQQQAEMIDNILSSAKNEEMKPDAKNVRIVFSHLDSFFLPLCVCVCVCVFPYIV